MKGTYLEHTLNIDILCSKLQTGLHSAILLAATLHKMKCYFNPVKDISVCSRSTFLVATNCMWHSWYM